MKTKKQLLHDLLVIENARSSSQSQSNGAPLSRRSTPRTATSSWTRCCPRRSATSSGGGWTRSWRLWTSPSTAAPSSPPTTTSRPRRRYQSCWGPPGAPSLQQHHIRFQALSLLSLFVSHVLSCCVGLQDAGRARTHQE